MSRAVILLLAGCGTVVAGTLVFAWRGEFLDQTMIYRALKSVQELPATFAPAPAASTAASSPTGPGADHMRPPAAAARGSGTVMAPSFDIARVEPNGRAVIAGRAAPRARVVLLDGGKEIARAETDDRGEWVLLVQDPPLAAGQHELRVVQHIEGRAPVTSEQVVVAVVPAPAGNAAGPLASRDETLVMVVPPGGVATLVQPASPGGIPRSGDLAMSTLDYDDRGHVTITGQATAGGSVRAYLDGALVAEGRAGRDGRWQLVPEKPIDPGKHTLRLDRLAETGKPTARLEIKFDRAQVTSPVGEGRRLHVVRGDNLWNISRAHYGEGGRFTVIFAANRDQIRDPNLIYPGQIFSLPKTN
jgi:nucleoid-associated protein YgaU